MPGPIATAENGRRLPFLKFLDEACNVLASVEEAEALADLQHSQRRPQHECFKCLESSYCDNAKDIPYKGRHCMRDIDFVSTHDIFCQSIVKDVNALVDARFVLLDGSHVKGGYRTNTRFWCCVRI